LLNSDAPDLFFRRADALREEAALFERRLGYLRAELTYAEAKADEQRRKSAATAHAAPLPQPHAA
jgi:hypothetical protein